MGTDSAAIFVRLRDVVGANRHEPTISNFEFPIELHKPFCLSSIFGAIPSAAEDENHGVLSLQVGKLPPFRGVVRKLIVGKERSRNDVRSHGFPLVGCGVVWFSIDL
jgi:hypothetical protein